tara:strand:+ start:222 stop:335 length:114 start_codon:yes stop_codon:yes gene_type:complete
MLAISGYKILGVQKIKKDAERAPWGYVKKKYVSMHCG